MAIKKVTAKKSLVKAQAGKIVKDTTLNKVDNKRMKSDLDKMREMDLIPPAYREEYLKLKNGPKPAKKELEKAKKGGTVPKAQSGLSIGQGPNNTAAKSNIGPKIAAAIGSATTAAGVAVNKLKKKRQAKLEKLKNEQTPEKKKGGSTGDKKWIQKAINPKHKGFCTPMTKPTCTPKRKALAKTLKAMAKKK
jgi:hypothetical protein